MKFNATSLRPLQLLFIIGYLLVSCDDESAESELRSELSVAEARLQIASARDANNLVTKITDDKQFYSVDLENGEQIKIRSTLLNSIEYDSATWQVYFHFIDQQIQSAHFIGKFDPSKIRVSVNPFQNSPLAALSEIEMPVKGRFKVIVHGKGVNGIPIGKTFDAYQEHHQIPVLGLYADFDNVVEFVFMNKDNEVRCSQSVTITTPPVENISLLKIQIQANLLPTEYSGLYVVSNWKVGFDQTGEVRWIYKGEGASYFGKVRNGNFIVATSNNQYFHEVTMLGQLVRKYLVPDLLHHEVHELPSGNFLVASHSPQGHPYEDVLVEIDRTSCVVVKSWDFNLILDPLRTALPDSWTGDWLHVNALYYDSTDNSIVISARSQCAVVKIDYSTGDIKWILGNHNKWGEPFQKYLLNPIDNQGSKIDPATMDFWPYGQHAISRLANGNILLYDNGDYRGFYDDPTVEPVSYTRGLEYQIDEDEKTVTLIWSFDHNKEIFTQYTGFIQQLAENRMIAYMWASENTPRVIEVDKNNNIVFDAMLPTSNVSYYRTYKDDLYGGIN